MNTTPQDPKHGNKGTTLMHTMLVMFGLTLLLNIVATILFPSARMYQIEYSQFLKLVDAGFVDRVILQDAQIEFVLKADSDIPELETLLFPEGKPENFTINLERMALETGRIDDPTLISRLEAQNVSFFTPIIRETPVLSFIISWVAPILFFYVIWLILGRAMSKRMGGAGGMMSVGKSRAKEYNIEKNTGVTFADVAGQDEAKESLMEIVDFLHNPEKYAKIGAKQPKGALLVGPPGTGKTLVAKAVAGEAGVPFYSLSGSEFVEMFVGVGASRVRDLFEQAKKNAPCIIFIDEIDAIGKSRDNQMGGNDEREQTLNQLLAEMDGFDSTSKGIVVLAATNRPEVLDKALLRPGRFDRRIIVEKPDLPGREAILAVHAKKVTLGDDVSLREIALSTSGASGADLANMVNEAALRAVKMGRSSVLQEDLQESVEVVIAGKEKRDRVMNKKERRMVAYHEVGHALVSALQTHSQPVQKITIVPRTMGSLGYTMNMPEEERYLMTKAELLAQINTLLGGRAAEVVEFGEITTGASNDIERATQIARSMVTQYGMSEAFGSMGLETQQGKYLDGRNVSTCSEETNARVDEEVRKIIAERQEAAIALVSSHKEALRSISEVLLEKENISGQQFMELFHAAEDAE